MGKWEKAGLDHLYRYVVEEGFILTQGTLSLRLNGDPFAPLKVNFTSFQLLRVHENHPIEIVDSGKITVRPYNDERVIGQILLDKNPKVYDAVSFFLTPWEIQLRKDYPGRVFTTLEGFEPHTRNRNPASLIYTGEDINKEKLAIDGLEVCTLSMLIPSQIPIHFHTWLSNAGKVQAYDEAATIEESWKEIGRFDFNDIAGVAIDVAATLEKRFGTRILKKDKREY